MQILFNEGEHTISQRKDIMIEQLGNLEAQVEELQSIISYLKHKIDNYESTLVKREMEQRNKLKGQFVFKAGLVEKILII